MKKLFKYITIMLLAIIVGACDMFELDNTDPNNLNPSQADPNFILNEMQLDFGNGYWNGINAPTRDITRMENMFDSYGEEVNPLTLQGVFSEWQQLYRSEENLRILKSLNTEGEIPYIVGIGQILQCWNWILMTDVVGELPFSQANNFQEFPEPNADGGRAIYDAVFEMLDESIDLLRTESVFLPSTDLYYQGETDNWIALANTLKIKMYLNLRLVDESAAVAGINSILANENFIDRPTEDFQFSFTTAATPVESRHPLFETNYISGATEYMSNYLIHLLKDSKGGVRDPRLRYYLYRQTSIDPEGQALPCAGQVIYDFCYLGEGYWGRDHGDGEGLPADNAQRTTYGLYPAGGAYDNDNFVPAVNSENAEGAGIHPIMLSSFTHFMLAEAALETGVNGDPFAYLITGINQSLDKVSGFAGGPEMAQADRNAYINSVTNEWNAATSDGERLFIITREYFIAAFGNGVEMYNMIRRTGGPRNPANPTSLSNLQSPVIVKGLFPRSFPYPQEAVNNNGNLRAIQNQNQDRVFWDNNPVSGFID